MVELHIAWHYVTLQPVQAVVQKWEVWMGNAKLGKCHGHVYYVVEPCAERISCLVGISGNIVSLIHSKHAVA